MTTTYSKEQIEKLLESERFLYHRVELPYGLHTPGQDRSATRDLVLPSTLSGKSVLDIGCALGYFCFEAEKRGATQVVGVELNERRHRQAMLLKEALSSQVEFRRADILSDGVSEQFDCVLLLNVIHHLSEPMRALRQVAALTRERLVLEFPTFHDEKFRRNVGVWFPWLYNRLPLIGVSSLEKDTDQTFVFTPTAIRRVLQDHAQLFREVKFVRSPMAGRQIAICTK